MPAEKSIARILSILFMAVVALVLSACGGGGGGGGGGGTTTQSIGGGGVKGPLANADVTAYAFDASAPGFKGSVIDTGTTDASAKITGLALPTPLTPPYILEFTSNSGTTDITTGQAPVITTMRTVLTQALIDGGEDIYATPLTTMATDLAVAKADSNVAPFTGDNNGTTTSAEFVAALPIAAGQVTSTLGFGVDSSIDIFDTPPLVDDTTDTTAEQTAVAAYRAAVEAVTAVVYEMDQQSAGTTPDVVLSEITSDLANDGVIDGTTETGTSTVLNATTLAVLEQDPATLQIPNTTQTVADVEAILDAETATTNTTSSTTALADGTISTVVEPAETNPDIDGDGVLNVDDAFPTDATETTDTDGDGTGNNADTDDDNDGVPDTSDAFPLDPAEHTDTDGDGTGNNADTDDDGDGVLDVDDAFPLDPSASSASDADGDGWSTGQDPDDTDATNPGITFTDTDGDGLADSGGAADDTDDDNDGVADASDCAPLDATKNVDTDSDGICDVDDSDDDNDGTNDTADAFPLDATEDTDTDGDGIGNNTDTDDDNDGVSDTQEVIDGTDPLLRDTDGDGFFDKADAFPTDATEHVDTDGDGTGNNADTDDDNDGVSDSAEITAGTKPLVADTDGDGSNDGADAFPLDATEDTDTDGDGTGNNADTDDDNDGLSDADEATAGTNPLLADTDGDGVNDGADAFPLDATESVDTDGDGTGNNADTDDDNDGVPDTSDAFPLDATESVDTDGDGTGNNADTDDDNDTVLDSADNCPLVANTDQADSDGNGVGDACDVDTDGDGVSDGADNCPAMANADQLDTDSDGSGDVCDSDDDNDGVPDTADAFPLDATESVDTDGDGTGDNADTDDDNDGALDTADAFPLDASKSDASGVWLMVATMGTPAELATSGCADADAAGTVNNIYLTLSQSGSTLTAKTAFGDDLSGSLDGVGGFTLSGTTTWTDPFTGDVDTDTINVSGSMSTTTTWTGNVSITNAFNGTDQCTETASLNSSFVYQHTGSEDYSGVYGLEGEEDGKRDSFVAEFTTTGGTLSMDIFSEGTKVITVNSYDPNTGFFSISINSVEDNDDGVTSNVWTDNITGIFVRDPAATSGAIISVAVDSYGQTMDGLGGTGNPVPGSQEYSDVLAYGKRMVTQTFNRDLHYRPSGGGGDLDGVIMGLLHPPLKGDNNLNQYVEVLDTDGVSVLCQGGLGIRYREFHMEPAVDMATEQFQGSAYSAVSCVIPAASVVDGMSYTVRIRDMGADGMIGGTDDTTISSATHTATLHTSPFTAKPGANDFALNGAAVSKTMKRGDMDGVINAYGFFDVTEDMSFDWTALTGATTHQVQIKRAGDYEQTRINVTAPTVNATIPAGTLDDWGQSLIRVRGIKTDTNGAKAFSNSKWILVNPGVNGLFNVELGTVVPQAYQGFQLALSIGMSGVASDCTVIDRTLMATGSTPAMTCLGASVDYTSNTVTLNMSDSHSSAGLGGGTFTLVLVFSDSANATVTSPDIIALDASNAPNTHVRLVNPELTVRSLRASNGAVQTHVVVSNAMNVAVGDTFDMGIFKRDDGNNLTIGGTDSGVATQTLWDNATSGMEYEANAGIYLRLPTDDGSAQPVGNYLRKRTAADWSMGTGLLDATTYKAVWTSTTVPSMKWVFKRDYISADPTPMVAPTLAEVTVNGTAAGTVGTSASPISVTAQPAFDVTWTGSTVTNGQWQLVVTDTTTGEQVRTPWMDASHGDLTDNGDGTWTWTNPGAIAVQSGQTVKVQIVTRDPANTMLGAQRNPDKVYLSN